MQDLPPDCQCLLLRLYKRKGRWVRAEEIHYAEVPNVPEALAQLCGAGMLHAVSAGEGPGLLAARAEAAAAGLASCMAIGAAEPGLTAVAPSPPNCSLSSWSTDSSSEWSDDCDLDAHQQQQQHPGTPGSPSGEPAGTQEDPIVISDGEEDLAGRSDGAGSQASPIAVSGAGEEEGAGPSGGAEDLAWHYGAGTQDDPVVMADDDESAGPAGASAREPPHALQSMAAAAAAAANHSPGVAGRSSEVHFPREPPPDISWQELAKLLNAPELGGMLEGASKRLAAAVGMRPPRVPARATRELLENMLAALAAGDSEVVKQELLQATGEQSLPGERALHT